jgi:hypothetical protein
MADTSKKPTGSGMGQTKPSSADRHNPKKGEHFRCGQCGMEIEVSKDCHCNKPESVHFECCGKELQRV